MPRGDTSFRAIVRAIWAADPENVPRGGCVESVVTVRTHWRDPVFRFVDVRFCEVVAAIRRARNQNDGQRLAMAAMKECMSAKN